MARLCIWISTPWALFAIVALIVKTWEDGGLGCAIILAPAWVFLIGFVWVIFIEFIYEATGDR